MIKTVIIDDMDKAMKLVAKQKYNEEIGRLRSSYFFRGMVDADYKLMTSLRRNCKHLSEELEIPMLRNFTKYAVIDDPTLKDSVWKQMIIGQHHGLPTRLLDWSKSPLIALHFANAEENFDDLEKRDAVVWQMNMQVLNEGLPKAYKDTLDRVHAYVFSVDMLTSVADSLEKYDSDMGDRAFVSVEPPSVDHRIINQYSFFSIIPSGIDDIEDFLERSPAHSVRYIIKKEIRWDLRDTLDQLNINERIVYPGIDGLTQWIARHYFVKKDESKSAAFKQR